MRTNTVIYYVGPDAKVGWVDGWSRNQTNGEIISINLTLNYHEAYKFEKLSRDYDDVCAKLLSNPGSFHCFMW